MFSPGGRLLLALLVCGAGVLSLFRLAWLPNECVMSYSYPSYHQVDLPAGAGSSYRLFAYVEAHGPGVRREPHTTGVPVVFIPGSGGSYKQVRSLASETAKQHAASPVGTILDWYALDFHEELSAFEGALLSRQRSFLVTTLQQLDAMYTAVHKPNAPPVILVGHSMGGVLACSVAAGMPDLVGAVLALASPLATSPWLGTMSIASIYVNMPDIQELTLPMASISGGVRDLQVPHWMTAAPRIVASLPLVVGVSADHQCIMWCNQGVIHISRALRHLASGDGLRRGGGGHKHREEELQKWFGAEQPGQARDIRARVLTAAVPLVIASLLALPALCGLHTLGRGSTGALIASAALRPLATRSAPASSAALVVAMLIMHVCGKALNEALMHLCSRASIRLVAHPRHNVTVTMLIAFVLVTIGAPTVSYWLLGWCILFTAAGRSDPMARLMAMYAWAATCAAPAAAAWVQIIATQGLANRPQPAHTDTAVALVALLGAMRAVQATQRSRAISLGPRCGRCAAVVCAVGASWSVPVVVPLVAAAAGTTVVSIERQSKTE